jgi:stage III sporulation protein AC
MGVEIIFKIAAIGILVSIVNQILKHSGKDEIATLTTLAGLIIVLLMVVDLISQLFNTVRSLFFLY